MPLSFKNLPAPRSPCILTRAAVLTDDPLGKETVYESYASRIYDPNKATFVLFFSFPLPDLIPFFKTTISLNGTSGSDRGCKFVNVHRMNAMAWIGTVPMPFGAALRPPLGRSVTACCSFLWYWGEV